VSQWLQQAGLDVVEHRDVPPEPNSDGKVAVSLWLGRDPRMAIAQRNIA
jgi:hypothetical protein